MPEVGPHEQVRGSEAQLTLEVPFSAFTLFLIPVLFLVMSLLLVTVQVLVFILFPLPVLVKVLLLVPVPLWPTPHGHTIRVEDQLGLAAQPSLDLPVAAPLLQLQDKQVSIALEAHLNPLAQV